MIIICITVCNLSSGDKRDLSERADCVTTGGFKEEERGAKRLYLGLGGEDTVTSWNIFICYVSASLETNERREGVELVKPIDTQEKKSVVIRSFRTEVLVKERVS